MIVYAVLICMGLTSGGLALSYGPDLPSGATVIVLAGIVYILVMGVRKLKSLRKNSG